MSIEIHVYIYILCFFKIGVKEFIGFAGRWVVRYGGTGRWYGGTGRWCDGIDMVSFGGTMM